MWNLTLSQVWSPARRRSTQARWRRRSELVYIHTYIQCRKMRCGVWVCGYRGMKVIGCSSVLLSANRQHNCLFLALHVADGRGQPCCIRTTRCSCCMWLCRHCTHMGCCYRVIISRNRRTASVIVKLQFPLTHSLTHPPSTLHLSHIVSRHPSLIDIFILTVQQEAKLAALESKFAQLQHTTAAPAPTVHAPASAPAAGREICGSIWECSTKHSSFWQ